MCAAIPLITAEKEGGKGSSRASFANEEGEIQVILVIPGQLRDSRLSTILVYTRGIDIYWAKPGLQRLLAGVRHVDSSVYSRSSVIPCLYQIIGDSFAYTRRSELLTPVAVVWRALLGPEHLPEE